ncbi:Pre-mRNA-splicing factor cwc21 [Penicillium cataractarum]|uniref:Pre-mRNA-splicing factor cwc21 n=1 Tax=Penicillium cataractarum TaxID=2100454 RepID=A0A9W9RXK3_9EURO|nr:Pre-mRNA-splicing factor cwc21 [Penicillium cataractarum]KAJ5368221.1 Pre-mRNA-splicing factor cwc21 [Penicillium cataractarum]
MSSNVGLSTPRGSGTSGYVQRNGAFLKPRAAGFGAPYPPVSGANSASDRAFKQRLPDKQILEHDRRRAIEVTVMEERERLEEENERIEEALSKSKGKSAAKKATKPVEDKEDGEEVEEGERVLSEEEIDERCEVLRQRLVKEMEAETEGGVGGAARGKKVLPKDRRQLKSYQVHELAEAKIQESERLRRALGLKEDRETGEISSRRFERRRD